ncbi:hypothetical protein G3A43_40055 [Paraburkholderia aspalathi]|uniref:hypothetical protein n=1 Tax=Paraburkholderia nemoris TaxID=2793076 RepID=UPI001909D51B|nr:MULTISPECIES: hypothetical protein [Paraburkholderia]MBK3786399.1 hypothetical protein [Paraburkholderia aspalathi]
MQATAIARGGRCLSTQYVNSTAKLEWECAEGHRWFAYPSNVKRGTWCAACVKERTYRTLADVQQAAQARGGRCLSEKYENNYTHLLFECGTGHRWQARAQFILKGTWCPHCARAQRRRTLEQMRERAARRGGQCLSETYVSPPQQLLWRCAAGHEWKATANTVYDHWCPECKVKRRRLGIGNMHELAATRGGACLSTDYVNTKTPLEWQCAKGHRWQTPPMTIIAGSWCPSCSQKRYTLADMQALAHSRGGKCLSDTYVSTLRHLQWLCGQGHAWSTTPAIVLQGHWCPECAILARCGSDKARRKYLAAKSRPLTNGLPTERKAAR